MTIPYNSKHAWGFAFIYFSVCWLIAWLSGTLQIVQQGMPFTNNDLQNTSWILFTIACIAVEIIAYYIIWPKGTLTHGRKLSWLSVIIFGLAWGISEGLWLLSIYRIAEMILVQRFFAALAAFIIISVFLGLWHQFVWDIYIAPEHNIAEWNAKKVFLCHIPNLMVTLSYLAIFNNAGMFVLFQTLSLLGSTYFMRFPAFWEKAS